MKVDVKREVTLFVRLMFEIKRLESLLVVDAEKGIN